MNMEVYVTCPFCYRVYDQLREPNVRIKVDRANRFAHVECIEKVLFVATPVPVSKPNGEGVGAAE